MAKIDAQVTMRPTSLLRKMREHVGDVSETSKTRLVCERRILGRRVKFYENGLRVIDGLDDQESYDSEILRFAHASILIKQPVGDKRLCYVDATKDPVELWLYNKQIKKASDLNCDEVIRRAT